jgi:hypothetical protein
MRCSIIVIYELQPGGFNRELRANALTLQQKYSASDRAQACHMIVRDAAGTGKSPDLPAITCNEGATIGIYAIAHTRGTVNLAAILAADFGENTKYIKKINIACCHGVKGELQEFKESSLLAVKAKKLVLSDGMFVCAYGVYLTTFQADPGGPDQKLFNEELLQKFGDSFEALKKEGRPQGSIITNWEKNTVSFLHPLIGPGSAREVQEQIAKLAWDFYKEYWSKNATKMGGKFAAPLSQINRDRPDKKSPKTSMTDIAGMNFESLVAVFPGLAKLVFEHGAKDFVKFLSKTEGKTGEMWNSINSYIINKKSVKYINEGYVEASLSEYTQKEHVKSLVKFVEDAGKGAILFQP